MSRRRLYTTPARAYLSVSDSEPAPSAGTVYELVETWRASPASGVSESLWYSLHTPGSVRERGGYVTRTYVLGRVLVTGAPVQVDVGRWGDVLGYVLPVRALVSA